MCNSLFPTVVSCTSSDMPHVKEYPSQPCFTSTRSLRFQKFATSRKALPLQMLKLNDNTGRCRYVGHSPRLPSSVGLRRRWRKAKVCCLPLCLSCISLQNAAQLPRGEVLTKLSSPELGSEFGQSSDSSLGSAGGSEFFENSDSKF